MKQYYIGIDLGGTNTKIALLGKSYNIIEKVSLSTNLYKGPQRLIPAIRDSVRAVLKRRKIKLSQIFGIGIGIAGLVDAEKGIVRNLINIPGWRNINIKREFEKRTKIPTFIDNDVNAMTLAEFYKGAGRGDKNLICVTLGTGVGGGIIIDGKLYRGSTSSAGEIGHIPINEKGPRCNCGGIACIESYVGNRYIARRTGLSPKALYEKAKHGDMPAIRYWKKIGAYIGVMLTGVINFFDPDKIIIGGGTAEAGSFIFLPLRDTIKKRAMEVQRRHVKIVKAKLGKDAGLVGAAILVYLERNK